MSEFLTPNSVGDTGFIGELEAFLALLDHGTQRKAAAALGDRGQSFISLRLKSLRRRMGGDPLIEKTESGFKLTPLGEDLERRARKLVHESALAAGLKVNLKTGRIGSLRVGFVGSSVTIMPQTVKDFLSTWPDVDIVYAELATNRQIELLRSQQLIDVGFLRDPPIERGDILKYHPVIREEPFVAVLPKTHRLRDQTSIDLADLKDDDWIVANHHDASGLQDAVIRACQRAGFVPRVKAYATAQLTILGFVAAGYGVSLAPRCVMDLFELKDSVFVDLKNKAPSSLFLAWNPVNLSPVAHNFIKIITSTGLSPFH